MNATLDPRSSSAPSAPSVPPAPADRPLLEARGLYVSTPEGRPLFADLDISLGHDRVALFGRNGVGKSTILGLLAGHARPQRGSVHLNVNPVWVRQEPSPAVARRQLQRWRRRQDTDPIFAQTLARELHEAGLRSVATLACAAGFSRGEARKLHLLDAKLEQPRLLLLDEPTQDLDEAGITWLLRWLPTWPHGLLVVSHVRRVLRCFEHFVLVAESGCRTLPGSFDAVERRLEQEDADRQRQYVKNLNTLAQQEHHHATVCQRRQRKKNVGRLHELRRCTSRARLNEKRSYAQKSQGKAAKIRQARIGAVREWARATRRALAVNLPLHVVVPTLPPDKGHDLVVLEDVGVRVGERSLFDGLSTRVGRQRLAVLGGNATGKTTLLELMLGQREPTFGRATRDHSRIGSIAQGATDWISSDSLLQRLATLSERPSLETLAQRLLAHRFPLALAERPLDSLSPGERVRAALLCLFQQAPSIELLVLDEPTYSLDFTGGAALRRVLRAWPGGLVVASHDREFLAEIGLERQIVLDGAGGHRLE
ncbi:MAG: ATP-binding cassette domain-containing protein [Myxococcota bacterium]